MVVRTGVSYPSVPGLPVRFRALPLGPETRVEHRHEQDRQDKVEQVEQGTTNNGDNWDNEDQGCQRPLL